MKKQQNLLMYLKNFFHNLFKKQKRIESAKEIEDTIQKEVIENFREDKEIMELQKRYEDEKILEEDLSEKQKRTLEELYIKQIQTLKQEINMYKKEIEFYKKIVNN